MVALATNMDMEVECVPGVLRRLRDCTVADLDLAREMEGRRAMLRVEAEILVGRAAEGDIELPDELREALSNWSGLLPELEALVSELHATVRT